MGERSQKVTTARRYLARQVSSGVLAEPLAVYPKDPEVPGARVPFQPTSSTETAVPDWVSLPFHSELIMWSPGLVQVTVQPFNRAAPVLATVTSAWNPPCQVPASRAVATQPPAGGAEVVVVVEVVVDVLVVVVVVVDVVVLVGVVLVVVGR